MRLLASIRGELRATPLREPWIWYRHRGLAPNDMLLASYPKSGNTWLRFMVGQMLVRQEMDFDTAKPMIPIVGLHRDAPQLMPGGGRVIKTHESYRPVYRQAVYLVRDVRDVAISFYYHQLRQGLYVGEWPAFLERFIAGKADGSGAWESHVASWLDSPAAQEGRLHVLKYEEVRSNPAGVMRGVTDFLGLEVSDDDIARAIAANSLNRMKDKEKTSTVLTVKRKDIAVVRNGRPGEWKEVLTEQEKATFLQRAGATLERLNYEV